MYNTRPSLNLRKKRKGMKIKGVTKKNPRKKKRVRRRRPWAFDLWS